MSKTPLVSFIILNWNGKKWLEQCLPTIKSVDYPFKEIIVVNNGSTDDSNDFIRKNFPEVKIIEIKKNCGYAKANNIGAEKAKGEFLVLMNNDTQATPAFLEPLLEDFDNDPNLGIVQPQIRSMIDKNLLDSVCSFLTFTGFLYYYGYMKSYKKEIYKKPLYAYSIKGSCFMMKRKDYVELGGFDEDFVCYVEETDLCHRVWLSGKKVMYEPRSYIYHWGGGDMQVMTKNELTIFRSFRNRIFSYLKNLSLFELIKLLPIHILVCEIAVIATFATGRFKEAIAAQLGILSPLLHVKKLLKKRFYIQRNIRKVNDKDINQFIKRNPRLSYYYYLFCDAVKYQD